jgi:hypothetical protein
VTAAPVAWIPTTGGVIDSPAAAGEARDNVTEQMRSQFGALLPVAVIAEVVQQAEQDLRGQASSGAMAELLHRLAEHRLTELVDLAR